MFTILEQFSFIIDTFVIPKIITQINWSIYEITVK